MLTLSYFKNHFTILIVISAAILSIVQAFMITVDPFFTTASIIIILAIFAIAYREYKQQDAVIVLIFAITSFNFYYIFFVDGNRYVAPSYTRATKDVIFFLFAISIYVAFLNGKAVKSRRLPAYKPIIMIWILIAAVFLWNLFFVSQAPIEAKFISARYYILYPLVGIFASWTITSQRVFFLFTKVYWFYASVVALLAVFAIMDVFGRSYASVETLIGVSIHRSISTLGDPNNLGIYLCIAMILLFTDMLYRPEQHNPIISRVTLIFWLLVTLTTFSRGSLIISFLVCSAIFLYSRKAKVDMFILGIIIASAIIYLFMQRGQTLEAAVQMRTDIWLRTGQVLRAGSDSITTQIIGHGLGFIYLDRDFSNLNDLSMGTKNFVDNAYISLFYSVGYIGLVLYLILLITYMYRSWSNFIVLRNTSAAGISLGIVGVQVFLLLYGIFLDVFVIFPASLLFWLLGSYAEGARIAHDNLIAKNKPLHPIFSGKTGR